MDTDKLTCLLLIVKQLTYGSAVTFYGLVLSLAFILKTVPYNFLNRFRMKTMRRWPCWCTKKITWGLTSFLTLR